MEHEFIKKEATVFWTRTVPKCDIFEVIPLKVHNVTETYFTGFDEHHPRTYLFGYSNLGKVIFETMLEADTALAEAQTTYYATHSKRKSDSFGYAVRDTDEYE